MHPKVGQALMIGLRGPELTQAEADFIVRNNIGGIILFKRNCVDPLQLRELCASVMALSDRMPDRVPLWIGIDHEGGRVSRLPQPFTSWPAASALGRIGSPTVAFSVANAMAAELNAAGINLSFAPCTDVLVNPKNTAIGDRALGSDAETVAKLSSAMVRGLIKGGVLPCPKHFPGHGNTDIDSHDDLPKDARDLAALEKTEFEPFRRVFRARSDLVMMAHVLFPAVDSEWPASLSETFIGGVLREKLRFRGLVVTDDLGMGALTKHYSIEQVAVRALVAGANTLLYCNDFEAPERALAAIHSALEKKEIPAATVIDNHQRVIELKKAKLTKFMIPSLKEAQAIIGSPQHRELAQAVAAGEVPAHLIASGRDERL